MDVELNVVYTEIVEVLNYSKIICKYSKKDFTKLVRELMKDHCNHLYRLKYVKDNGLFYIENCDLQDLDYDDLLYYLIEEDYILVYIKFTDNGFYFTKQL